MQGRKREKALVQLQQENQTQRHIYLYDTQGDDPLWSDRDDCEDALPGGY